jgi:polysaccharide biosynthesis protein PslE
MSGDAIKIERQSSQMSMRDLFYVLFRHKWKMLLFFVAVVSTVTFMTMRAQKIYHSDSKLLVRLGRENMTLDPSTTGTVVGITRSIEAEVLTELGILQSHRVLERTAVKLGSDTFANTETTATEISIIQKLRNMIPRSTPTTQIDPLENKVLKLGGMIRVEKAGLKSNILNVTCEAPNPKEAQKILSTFVEAYLDEHVVVHSTSGSFDFITSHSSNLKDDLLKLDNQIQELKETSNLSNYDAELQIRLTQIGSTRDRISTAQSDLEGSKARISELVAALADLPETLLSETVTGLPNATADRMRERLYTLKLQEQDMLSKYSEDSRQVEDIRRQIKAAEDILNQEDTTRTQLTHRVSTIRDRVEQDMMIEQANKSSFEAQIVALSESLNKAEKELQNCNKAGTQIKRLERELALKLTNYRNYSESLEKARIDKAMETDKISNISILQAATLPINHIRPNKPIQIALGLLLGFVGAIAVAFISEHADHAITTPEGVEKALNLSTLISVPYSRKNAVCPTGRKRSLIGARHDGDIEHVHWDIPRGVRGQYEILRDQILISSKGASKNNILGITSSRRREGVSVIAANVAALLADEKRVLLIDTNVKHPCSSDIFNMKVSLGLMDVLTNRRARKSAIWNSPIENLDLMPVGTLNSNRHEISSDDMNKLITLLKKDYDCIVLDLPAVNDASYTARLASLCDNVSLVVDAENSRREAVLRAQEKMARLDANVLGVVLNKRRFPIPNWIYKSL